MRRPKKLIPPLSALLLGVSCAPGGLESEGDDEIDLGVQRQALNGVEGTFEYALDAPFRLEPSVGYGNRLEYSPIPIQFSLHDADIVDLDGVERGFGRFCSISVDDGSGRAPVVYPLAQLDEVERAGRWMTPNDTRPNHANPQALEHEVCRPSAGEYCVPQADIGASAEWHAMLWHEPRQGATPGQTVKLTVTASISEEGRNDCKFTLKNHLWVKYAEAPLPRFGDEWLFGDLHFHGQGTDNEGETGYNYRGVVRTMGAMGLDFAFATEHASNAQQLMDVEVDRFPDPYIEVHGIGLRDMSAGRFQYLLTDLTRPGGINRASALQGAGGVTPQTFRTHRTMPQLFLGGELDVIPEGLGLAGVANPSVPYGNGLTFPLTKLLGGWNDELEYGSRDREKPTVTELVERASNGDVIRDIQGDNDVGYGRDHLVYLPRSGSNTGAFIGSVTSKFGGASRRLAQRHGQHGPMLPEIESHGYAFLAHPLNDSNGGEGPDGVPWTPHMLDTAWRSRGILGLQFWNEPGHLSSKMGEGDARDIGFGFDPRWLDSSGFSSDQVRDGFKDGKFEMIPLEDMATRTWSEYSRDQEKELHHGAYTWDKLLLKGLSPTQTRGLSWLPAGQPRRFFMAAGSDAHGDFNYHRSGYFRGMEKVKEGAMGRVRNMVNAGAPSIPAERNVGNAAPRHAQEQVVDALAAGNFAVTDGPALRIVIDQNLSGTIDAGDIPMGGVFPLHFEKELPLLIEWKSTPEFGDVSRIDLYVGVAHSDLDGQEKVYAPALHGPREGSLPNDDVMARYRSNNLTYERMRDNYMRDPLNILRREPRSQAGVEALSLPIAAFEPAQGVRPDRLYVRAFAHTKQFDHIACEPLFPDFLGRDTAQRRNLCREYYAFTNPVWAVEVKPAPIDKDCRSGASMAGYASDAVNMWRDGPSGAQGRWSISNVATTGSSFGRYSDWAKFTGDYVASDEWLAGDFTGDGLTDMLNVWDKGRTSALSVRVATGSTPQFAHWYAGDFHFSPWTQWLPADFDGDGRTDVVAVWKDGQETTFTVFRSLGNGFSAPLEVNTRDGGWNETTRWTVGDFDADGKDDLLGIWNYGGNNALTVRRSNGISFTHEHWNTNGGTFFNNSRWLAGDFTGDGKADAAIIFKDADWASVSVFRSTGTSFAAHTRWTIRDQVWNEKDRLSVGDYDGDGKDDLMSATPANGFSHLIVRRSLGASFSTEQWADARGGWFDTTRWCSGVFRR